MPRLTALLGLLAVLSTALFAETEIIVTASRVEEDARSTPAYVRVISEEEIRRGDTVLDALRSLPDISIKESSPGNEYISMGGFGANGFARTLVLIDGRPINRPDMAGINWRTIPLDRVERIEVVKGALSSQYGDQAVAGAVNIIMKEPDGLDIWIRSRIGINLSNSQSVGAGWGNETTFVESGVSREDLRPTRDRSDSTTWTTFLNSGGRLGAVELDFDGQFTDTLFELPGSISKSQFEDDPDLAVNTADDGHQRVYETALSTRVGIGEYDVSLPISWRRTDSRWNSPSWGPGFNFSDAVLDTIQGGVQIERSFISGRGLGVTSVIGIDTSYSAINVKTYSERERINQGSDETVNRIEAAPWLRTQFYLGEQWVIDAGGRLSYMKVSDGSTDKDYFPAVFDIGSSWLPDESWAISLRYGRVFRYPLLDEQILYYSSPTSFNSALEPEYGHQINVSVEYGAGQIALDLSPYFLFMNDEIVFDLGLFENRNIGRTYHYGFSAGGSWNRRIIGLSIAYSLDRAQFVDTSKLVPLVPQHTINGRLSINPVDTLEISTDARYSSGFYAGGDDSNSESQVPGRFVWDARVEGTPIDGLTFYSEVGNILDDRNPTMAYAGGAWYPSEGRTVTFGADWRY